MGGRVAIFSNRPSECIQSTKYVTLQHILRTRHHLPSFSPRALPTRNLDTNGVLDKDKQVEIKTLWVGLICKRCPHNKPNAIINSVI